MSHELCYPSPIKSPRFLKKNFKDKDILKIKLFLHALRNIPLRNESLGMELINEIKECLDGNDQQKITKSNANRILNELKALERLILLDFKIN